MNNRMAFLFTISGESLFPSPTGVNHYELEKIERKQWEYETMLPSPTGEGYLL